MNIKYLLFLVLVNLICNVPAQAIVLSSHNINHKGKPGTVISGSLSLRNEKAHAVDVEIFKGSVENANFEDPEWLIFETRKLSFSPTEQKEFFYQIHIPENAEGQLTAKVSFQTKNAQKAAASPLSFNTRVSIYFIVIVQGTEIYDCDILKIEPSSEFPKKLVLHILNTSNIYIKPKGTGVIRSKKTGKVITQCVVNQNGISLYNKHPREIIAEMRDPLSPGEYEIELTLESPEGYYTIKKTSLFTIPDLKDK